MTSKGIDAYAYVSNSRCKVTFDARGNSVEEFNSSGAGQMRHYEIDSKNLGYFEATGRFTMRAYVDGQEVLQKWAEISPLTGGAAGVSDQDNLNDMVHHQQSQVKPGHYAVSFGFFDAGGWSGYSDRAYMSVTEDFSNWMGALTRQNRNVPFGMFVLPGSHDCGMFTVLPSDDFVKTLVKVAVEYWNGLSDAEKAKIGVVAGLSAIGLALIGTILGALNSFMIGTVVAGMATRAITNLSNTQKDSIATQLLLGIRMFDFRPGYNLDGKDRVLRHQHNFVPGYEFDKFLNDVVDFLINHPAEIVMVNLSSAGFIKPSTMIPPEGEINALITKALSSKPLLCGDKDSLKLSYQNLLDSNRRLIIVRGGSRDNYSDDAYQTQDPNKVIAALNGTFGMAEKDWTCLQLQATYNATKEGALSGALNFSDASSTLLWTKTQFDSFTYPWALQNVAERGGSSLCVMQNDFADNSLTDVCVSLTKKRIARMASDEEQGEIGNIKKGTYIDVKPEAFFKLVVLSGQVTASELGRFLCEAQTLLLSSQDFSENDRGSIQVESNMTLFMDRTLNKQEFKSIQNGVIQIIEFIRAMAGGVGRGSLPAELNGVTLTIRGMERFFDINNLPGANQRAWVGFDLR